MLTTQRNGSTWLMSVLNALEGVTAQGELFLPRPRSPDKRWDSDFAHPYFIESEGFGSRRRLAVFRYLRDFYDGPDAAGFKLMYSQVRAFPEVLLFLMRERIPVVHLVRRNHLDVLISFVVKRHIGQAHILSAQERPQALSVELDTTSLVSDLARLERKHGIARAVLKTCRLRHIEVGYEELLADPAQFAHVLEFLGLPPAPVPESHILRTRVGGQREVVSNYEDVQRTLGSSRFTYLLD